MWRYKQEIVDQLWQEGKIVITENRMPRIKRYLDKIQGQALHYVWTGVHSINSQADTLKRLQGVMKEQGEELKSTRQALPGMDVDDGPRKTSSNGNPFPWH